MPAGVNVNHLDTGLFEDSHHFLRILYGVPSLHLLIDVETAADGEVFAHFLSHAFNNFENNPHAVFQTPAVLVLTLIGDGGEEAIQQISSAYEHLDGVKAALTGSAGCLSVFFYNIADFGNSERPRNRARHLV